MIRKQNCSAAIHNCSYYVFVHKNKPDIMFYSNIFCKLREILTNSEELATDLNLGQSTLRKTRYPKPSRSGPEGSSSRPSADDKNFFDQDSQTYNQNDFSYLRFQLKIIMEEEFKISKLKRRVKTYLRSSTEVLTPYESVSSFARYNIGTQAFADKKSFSATERVNFSINIDKNQQFSTFDKSTQTMLSVKLV